MKQFFEILFDEGECINICWDKKDTRVFPVHSKTGEMFSINPLDGLKDHKPGENHSGRPRRADHNVLAYRNILVELDEDTTKNQYQFIQKTGLPYSTCVYSGNKSLHFLISLETPLESEEAYRNLCHLVFYAINSHNQLKVDTNCKNPSRMSRYPGAIRQDTQLSQDLIELKSRIPNEVLDNWIKSKIGNYRAPNQNGIYGNEAYMAQLRQIRDKYGLEAKLSYNGFTKNYLMFGAPKGERNSSLFKVSCDLFKCGYTYDEIVEKVSEICNLDKSEMRNTILSAKNKVAG